MSKKKVTNKNDIIELSVKRFLAMVIDWYLTNMLAVIPITFYFRNGDYLQPYMFDFTHYDFQTALLLILYWYSNWFDILYNSFLYPLERTNIG